MSPFSWGDEPSRVYLNGKLVGHAIQMAEDFQAAMDRLLADLDTPLAGRLLDFQRPVVPLPSEPIRHLLDPGIARIAARRWRIGYRETWGAS